MDIRSILDKLDAVVLAENISLQDIETAIKGKENDEQARAEILNDLAWKNKLPGLYDPVSGGWVRAQSISRGMGGGSGISIGATGSERSDRALADLGLIPDNAKTSTALGRMFRGDDKDQYSQDIKTRSQGAVLKQRVEKFKTDTLPKLKDLVTKLNSTVSAVKSGSSLSQSSGIGLKLNKTFESNIFESLLKEFQDEVIDQDIEERVDGPGAKLAPEVQQVYDELKALLATAEKDGIGKDPEMAKELEAVKTAMATAEKDGVEKPAAAPATTGGTQDGEKKPSPYDLTPPEEKKKFPADYNKDGTDKSKEERLARVKELLAKAKEPKKAVPMVSPKTESMSELIARIQRIAEGTNELQEALTAAEYKELQTYAAGLKTDFANDPEIQALAQQALSLPAQFSSDEKPTTTTDPNKPVDPNKPTDPTKNPAVSDPKIKKIQEQLIALGIPLPKYGADGKLGNETVNAIKAFEKLAGLPETGKITPELEKLLADGKNVIARSKLVQSMAAIEKLLTKYKISESVTLEDLDLMTEGELRSFVMANIKVFTEAEQMSILKQYITESDADAILDEAFKLSGEEWSVVSKNPTTGEIILKSKAGKVQSSTELMKLFPAEMKRLQDLEKNVAKSTRVPVTGEVDPRKVQGTGSVKDLSATEKDLKSIQNRRDPKPGVGGSLDKGVPAGGDVPGGSERKWYQRAGDIVKGAFKGKAKAAAAVTAGVLTAGGLYLAFSGDSAIQMDPADLAELQKHLKVIDEYGKNPEIVKGLPTDVQERLSKLIKNLEKLKSAKAKAAPAPASDPASGGA